MTSGYEKELDAQDPLWVSLLQTALAMLVFVVLILMGLWAVEHEPASPNLNAVGQLDWGAVVHLALFLFVLIIILMVVCPFGSHPHPPKAERRL